jgi:hypothetical protein
LKTKGVEEMDVLVVTDLDEEKLWERVGEIDLGNVERRGVREVEKEPLAVDEVAVERVECFESVGFGLTGFGLVDFGLVGFGLVGFGLVGFEFAGIVDFVGKVD